MIELALLARLEARPGKEQAVAELYTQTAVLATTVAAYVGH